MTGPYGPNNPDEQWSRNQGQQEEPVSETHSGGELPTTGQPWEQQAPSQQAPGQQAWGQAGPTSGQPTQGYPQQPPYPQGQYPAQPQGQGNYPTQSYEQGQFPQGQYPQGQFPQGQFPQGQFPQGQFPQGQYPQGQNPQGQFPQGQFPQGQYPQGQYGGMYPGQQPGQQQWNPGQQSPQGTKSKTPLFVIGGLVVAILLIGGVLFATLGGTKTLDADAAEAGIEEIVSGTYGATSVSNVDCPTGQAVEKGASFDCSVRVDGIDKKVTLTFTDDTGTYEVSRPR
ncbi:DUF4333 domain-containing protein [Rhodococcus sp. BP22]|uniref:DUF4333 domain-containing protein n=1 Tax=Rhodococcus sp. BP22 TaxID=2758566 RepID=UPI00164681CD|nr:DUF4333 domain-containing protein [Rhodococcus sp. BP22]